jgi:hypothetical protein
MANGIVKKCGQLLYQMDAFFQLNKDTKNLVEELGPSMTPQKLGKVVGLTRNTVVKYAHRYGGVEVAPGVWRFFENRVKEFLYAKPGNQARQAPLSRGSDGGRQATNKAVSRCQQGQHEGLRSLGGKSESANGGDPYGIFDDP